MKIGVVTTSYPRAPDDPAGGFVRASAQWLAAAGHDVEVVAAGPGMLRDGAVRVRRVRAGASLFYGEGAPDRLERQPWRAASAALFAAALAAAVARARGRWDAVVSHWLLPSGAVAAATRLPHVAVAHSGDVALALRLGLARPLARALAGTRVAFVAEHLREAFCRAAGRPLDAVVCPMGVVPPAPMDRAEARRRLGLDGRPVVAFLGRLVPIKGIDLLARAAAGLDAWLAVAGDGPLRPEGPHVRRLGELRGRDRDALFAAADVLAVPSRPLPNGRGEGAPQVVLEALAAGVPLVASDLPGVRELAADAAVLVPPGDAGALAAALRGALVAPPDAAAARRRAAAYAWDRIGPRLFDPVFGPLRARDALRKMRPDDVRRSRGLGGRPVPR
ncbi:MAG TPA: glycosyltransferase family 4 protein [Haliangiales bacterium]|nr:glycosyltransferase family 4 protein [Haliangiales bacterium]